jgi:hypothetical protein
MLALTRWNAEGGIPQLSELRRRLSNEGMVTVGNDVLDLGPGDRLDVAAGAEHSVEVVGLAPAVYVTGTTERSLAPAGTR